MDTKSAINMGIELCNLGLKNAIDIRLKLHNLSSKKKQSLFCVQVKVTKTNLLSYLITVSLVAFILISFFCSIALYFIWFHRVTKIYLCGY